ncbi:MAG: hypothetical protein EOO41_04405, partial [Methanobacteriota archaeon]
MEPAGMGLPSPCVPERETRALSWEATSEQARASLADLRSEFLSIENVQVSRTVDTRATTWSARLTLLVTFYNSDADALSLSARASWAAANTSVSVTELQAGVAPTALPLNMSLAVPVDVTLNGQQYSSSSVLLTLQRQPRILGVLPSFGGVSGGTEVSVSVDYVAPTLPVFCVATLQGAPPAAGGTRTDLVAAAARVERHGTVVI